MAVPAEARLPYSNGVAPKQSLVFVEGMWVTPYMAANVRYIAKYCRDRGVSFSGTQGYRWLGVRADRQIGASDYSDDEAKADETSDGTANQWYQLGRQDIGKTSAAPPTTSNHGDGLSIDTNVGGPNALQVRRDAMADVGMEDDIRGETWHGTIVGPRLIDLSAFEGGSEIPIEEEEPDEEEYGMSTVYIAKDAAGVIPQGWSFLQGDDGVLRPLSALEYEAHKFAHPKSIDVMWAGQDIWNLAMSRGIYEYTGDATTGPLGLTGRIIGRNATKSNPAGTDGRHFPNTEPSPVPDPTTV